MGGVGNNLAETRARNTENSNENVKSGSLGVVPPAYAGVGAALKSVKPLISRKTVAIRLGLFGGLIILLSRL
jgi:hypothetical protein